MSSTASVHSDKEIPSAKRAEQDGTINEYEDAEKNFQPKSLKFWTIIVGVYLSIFLVALVRAFSVRTFTTPDVITGQVELTRQAGSDYNCNGHSTYHR